MQVSNDVSTKPISPKVPQQVQSPREGRTTCNRVNEASYNVVSKQSMLNTLPNEMNPSHRIDNHHVQAAYTLNATNSNTTSHSRPSVNPNVSNHEHAYHNISPSVSSNATTTPKAKTNIYAKSVASPKTISNVNAFTISAPPDYVSDQQVNKLQSDPTQRRSNVHKQHSHDVPTITTRLNLTHQPQGYHTNSNYASDIHVRNNTSNIADQSSRYTYLAQTVTTSYPEREYSAIAYISCAEDAQSRLPDAYSQPTDIVNNANIAKSVERSRSTKVPMHLVSEDDHATRQPPIDPPNHAQKLSVRQVFDRGRGSLSELTNTPTSIDEYDDSVYEIYSTVWKKNANQPSTIVHNDRNAFVGNQGRHPFLNLRGGEDIDTIYCKLINCVPISCILLICSVLQ